MLRIEFPPKGGQDHFSHALGLPKDLDFGTVFGGWALLYSFWGIPSTLQAPLGSFLGSLGCTRLPLGTLSDALWSFTADLALRKNTIQSVGSSTLGHSQNATILLWGGLWCPGGLSGTRLTLLWASAALSGSAQGAIVVCA